MSIEMITDEQVENEIKRLVNSPYVKLAKAEQREKYRRRQYAYQLRWYEKRGIKLESEGYSIEDFNKTNEVQDDDSE